MEIPQEQFERLLEQIRELTARVYRLEEKLEARKPEPKLQASPIVPQATPPHSPLPQLTPAPLPPRAEAPKPLSPPRFVAQPSGDLESRIGSHWLNRIGIAAVLVGASFFLNYAFENGWIGPVGRIVIGLIAGIAMVWWSEHFRKRGYHIFSYSLKALGIGVVYLSLWAAFQVYHLLPSGVVFAFMVVVTALTCGMALVQNAEILAVFAIAGGFSTPVLLSTGENREIALFSYLIVLDIAILALTIAKSWRRISLLGFIGTLGLYTSWYAEFYDRSQLTPTLLFASLFFAIFAAAPFFILRDDPAANTAPLLALVNGITYFVQGYLMLNPVSSNETAWFALLLASVYLLLVRLSQKAPTTDATNALRLIHLALAIGLITVAIPIRLEGHTITIGWLVEAAALLWVGGRIRSDVFNWFALIALVLGVLRLLFWDTFAPAQLIFNERMAAYLVAVLVLGFCAYQCSRHADETWNTVAGIAIIALNLVALRALSLEVADYYSRQMPVVRNVWSPEALLQRRGLSIARDFTYSALWMAYGATLMTIGFWRKSAFVRWQALVLIGITIAKVFVYDTSELDHIYRILSFIALGILLLATSFAYQRNWLKLPSQKAA